MCGSCRPCSSPHTGQAPSFGGGIVNRPSRSSNNQPPSLLGTDRAKRKPLRPVTVFPVCQFYADRFPPGLSAPGGWSMGFRPGGNSRTRTRHGDVTPPEYRTSSHWPCVTILPCGYHSRIMFPYAGLSRLPSLSPSDTGRPVALFRSLPPLKVFSLLRGLVVRARTRTSHGFAPGFPDLGVILSASHLSPAHAHA